MFSHSYILEIVFSCIFCPRYLKTKQQLADIYLYAVLPSAVPAQYTLKLSSFLH